MGQDCQKVSGEFLEDIQYCIEGRTDEKEMKKNNNFKKIELQQKSVQLKKLDEDEDDDNNVNDNQYDENNNYRKDLDEDNNMRINDNYGNDVKEYENNYDNNYQ